MARLMFAVVLFVFSLCYAEGNEVVRNGLPMDGCVCEKFGCSCCLYMDVPQIWLNDTACISFAYDPDAYGISFVLTIDDKALINETISARDPPPICYPVPVIEDFVDMCVHFTDLSILNNDFHGCVALEIRMWWVYVVAEFKLGCFDTNPHATICKKHIDKVVINKVPVFHNQTGNYKYKYNLVPMQDMAPVNEAGNISESQKEVVNFHLLNVTTVSPKADVNVHLLNVTTISPKEDVNVHLLNVTAVPPKDVSFYLLNMTTLSPNQKIQVNQTISKVNRSMISDELPFCAGNSNFIVSLPYLLFLVVLQTAIAVNLIKFF